MCMRPASCLDFSRLKQVVQFRPINDSWRGVTMRSTTLLFLPMAVLLTAVSLLSQNVNPMHPEEIQVQKHASPDDMRARVASVQFQKDSDELADLCVSVRHDMDGVKQGVVSKDLLDKLKHLERLSKRVREQLVRTDATP
jgi:hypothetical protein